MARYTDASKERVKDAADMVAIVGVRVELKRAGTNRYVGLCPFHDERTPSFGINPVEKVYYCFGCQASGDLFSFVMETEGVDFKGALELVAQRSGVTLELEAEPAGAVKARRSRERQLATVDRAAAFYAAHLWSAAGRRVLAYLASRGLEEAVLREFRVGVAPDLPDGLISAAGRGGVTAGDLGRAGLTIEEGTGVARDRFRNRIMFPVSDWSGKVVGFGARRLRETDRAKYVNSPASDLFRKKELLFGASQARKHAAREQASVFVEGYMDVLALHQADVRNAVAPMGTSVTEEQIVVLRRLAPTVILFFDGDNAGRAAALEAGRLAVAGGLDREGRDAARRHRPRRHRRRGRPRRSARAARDRGVVRALRGRVRDRRRRNDHRRGGRRVPRDGPADPRGAGARRAPRGAHRPCRRRDRFRARPGRRLAPRRSRTGRPSRSNASGCTPRSATRPCATPSTRRGSQTRCCAAPPSMCERTPTTPRARLRATTPTWCACSRCS